MVTCGGDGLVMTKSVRIYDYFASFNAKCDGLNGIVLLTVHYVLSVCEISVYRNKNLCFCLLSFFIMCSVAV